MPSRGSRRTAAIRVARTGPSQPSQPPTSSPVRSKTAGDALVDFCGVLALFFDAVLDLLGTFVGRRFVAITTKLQGWGANRE